MINIKLEKFEKHIDKYKYLLVSAGFEERTKAIALKLKDAGKKIRHSFIIDYNNIKNNEPNRTELINLIRSISRSIHIIPEAMFKVNLRKLIKKIKSDFLIDITGMSRLQFFFVMYLVDSVNISYDIGYTEAELYYPDKAFYDDIINYAGRDKNKAFTKYQENTENKIIYSFDCDVIEPTEFRGRPDPGSPAALVGFLTFKRSRLQAILGTYQFSKRLLLLGEPVREDLKWRKDMMELANFDLLKRRNSELATLTTLFPTKTINFLEQNIYKNRGFSKYNIFLAPLGSKMQALGAYLFWRNHPEITLVFSQPKTYFKDAYSKLWRNSFVIQNTK